VISPISYAGNLARALAHPSPHFRTELRTLRFPPCLYRLDIQGSWLILHHPRWNTLRKPSDGAAHRIRLAQCPPCLALLPAPFVRRRPNRRRCVGYLSLILQINDTGELRSCPVISQISYAGNLAVFLPCYSSCGFLALPPFLPCYSTFTQGLPSSLLLEGDSRLSDALFCGLSAFYG
jgi:hypothetical protein